MLIDWLIEALDNFLQFRPVMASGWRRINLSNPASELHAGNNKPSCDLLSTTDLGHTGVILRQPAAS